MPAMTAETTKANSLYVLDAIAEEAHAAFGVAHRDQRLAVFGAHDRARDEIGER